MRLTEAICAAQMTKAEREDKKERFTHVHENHLLSIGQVATILGVSTKTVRRHRAALEARGLKGVRLGHLRRYSAKSLGRLIESAAQSGRNLFGER